MPPRKKTQVFISFDYDYDQDLKNLLIGQARNATSPFRIEDWSIKNASRSWKSEARARIRRADRVIVICGYYTHQAAGVSAELKIAREEHRPYFLLQGRRNGGVRRPSGTWFWERIHPWTWESLRAITTGNR